MHIQAVIKTRSMTEIMDGEREGGSEKKAFPLQLSQFLTAFRFLLLFLDSFLSRFPFTTHLHSLSDSYQDGFMLQLYAS